MAVAYCRFAGVIKTEEEEFRMLVCQPKLGQHVPDCARISINLL